MQYECVTETAVRRAEESKTYLQNPISLLRHPTTSQHCSKWPEKKMGVGIEKEKKKLSALTKIK